METIDTGYQARTRRNNSGGIISWFYGVGSPQWMSLCRIDRISMPGMWSYKSRDSCAEGRMDGGSSAELCNLSDHSAGDRSRDPQILHETIVAMSFEICDDINHCDGGLLCLPDACTVSGCSADDILL